MTKQEEFIESLKALMVRYNIKLITDENDAVDYYFVSEENNIEIYVGDIE